MDVKAILVAGGSGSRLSPFTKYTQKTLLPLHKRPVIDYALGAIRRSGIKHITIIANQFIGHIAKHVGAGLPGEVIHYVMEEEPRGVAHALNLARPFNENCRLMVYFCDNITTLEFDKDVVAFKNAKSNPGCILLAREESNPRAFGVAVMNGEKVIDIVEKPQNPPSNLAIGGIYVYDERFWEFYDDAIVGGEEHFSISNINRRYVKAGEAVLRNVGEGTWVDCGTPDSLLQASIMARDGKLDPNPHR
jgi:glucose-1-phosphate thymidylyltransferase